MKQRIIGLILAVSLLGTIGTYAHAAETDAATLSNTNTATQPVTERDICLVWTYSIILLIVGSTVIGACALQSKGDQQER